MNNLRAARKAANMTQAEVGKVVGVSPNGYSYWESGKVKIDHESLEKLAALFDVSVDYLLGRTDIANEKPTRIPELGTVPAGIPLEAIEDIIDWEEIPAAMCAGGKEYFALEVKGDSMWPDYLPGDVVIVRKTPHFNSGDICVVYINGYNATLKQVRQTEEGLAVIPKNQQYPPRTYSPDEVRTLPITIAGVVVELRRKIK